MDQLLNDLFNTSKEGVINHKLVAVIFKGNNLLSKLCCNSPKISNKKILDYYINHGSIHAEANAILSYYGKSFYYNKYKNLVYLPNDSKGKKNNIDLIVARFNKKGIMCNARPCYNCLELMKLVGIRKVYYTTEDGIICEDIKNMISILITSSLRNNLKTNDYNNYIELLKNQLHQPICEYNFNLFIKYNLSKILPNYSYEINKIKNNKYINIYDENKNIIVYSILT